jgi:hypothetical protein
MKAQYIPTINDIKDTSNFIKDDYDINKDEFVQKVFEERQREDQYNKVRL